MAARDIRLSLVERSTPLSTVAGVVMAAGSSRRFGGDKLLEPFRGRPLLCWVVDAALRSRLAFVNVILGHRHRAIRAAVMRDVDGAGLLTFTINDEHERGQSASIVAGLTAVSAECTGAMFLVGDQPLLDAGTIDRLIAFFESSPRSICYPCCDGQRRNPVIFPRRFFADLRQLRGDVGGSAVIAAHPEAGMPVTFGDPKPFFDIDRRADIDLLSAQVKDSSGASAQLIGAFGLETSRVISFCGSGGKTSLMAALVREFAAAGGDRILVTATTKMAIEELDGPWCGYRAADAPELIAAIGNERRAVLAYRTVDVQRGRILGLSTEMVDTLARSGRFTRILIEADGSRRRPLKAPGANEPLFPESTDVVVMVAGLSGLGTPVSSDTIFRPDRWVALAGSRPSERVSAEAVARVVTHPGGLARGAPARSRRVLYLNQADTPERMAEANLMLNALSSSGEQIPERVVVGRLQPQPQVCALRVFAACKQNVGERR